MNAQSSRSHALLTLTLERKGADGSVRVSRLNVADLAGSEKVSRTGAAGEPSRGEGRGAAGRELA
jgi:hypothetical protein